MPYLKSLPFVFLGNFVFIFHINDQNDNFSNFVKVFFLGWLFMIKNFSNALDVCKKSDQFDLSLHASNIY